MKNILTESRIKKDFDYIISSFNSWKKVINDNFSDKLNESLSREIRFESIYEYIKNYNKKYNGLSILEIKEKLKTITIIKIDNIKNIKIKENKSLFFFLNKKKEIQVDINAFWDYYYLVNWVESWISCTIDENIDIFKGVDLKFTLIYKEINNKYILFFYYDNMLYDVWY